MIRGLFHRPRITRMSTNLFVLIRVISGLKIKSNYSLVHHNLSLLKSVAGDKFVERLVYGQISVKMSSRT